MCADVIVDMMHRKHLMLYLKARVPAQEQRMTGCPVQLCLKRRVSDDQADAGLQAQLRVSAWCHAP